MSGPCYGFSGPPDTVDVSVEKRWGDIWDEEPRVIVNPTTNEGTTFSWSPDQARQRAEMIREHSDKNKCNKLADELEEKADIVEAMKEQDDA